MCGIVLTTDGHDLAQWMLDQLKHRGPDGDKVVTYGQVSIGHARLAIVDVNDPDANQPYCKNTHYSIAFNGEIFNQRSLNKDATEVMILGELMAAEHDLTQLLNGYYAIAFHDIGRSKIVLARDLYGVMPLYYSYFRGNFYAASEKKAIPTADIVEVPANSKVEFDLKTRQLTVTKFSQPFRYGQRAPTLPELEGAFDRAVLRTAMHSENGFSVALSGGLDSSMVLAACVHQGLKPAAILTCYAQTDDTSEVDRAVALVRQYGMSHLHKLLPVEDIPEYKLRAHIETPPNPIRDFAFKRHATVARHAPTKVILCGEGADELGLGYPLNRKLTTSYDRYFKKVSLLKSQATMTLDRVNKAGMMYSKEYRVPFLDIDFSLMALNIDQVGKSRFRDLARDLYLPPSIINASKYSNEETVGRSAIQT